MKGHLFHTRCQWTMVDGTTHKYFTLMKIHVIYESLTSSDIAYRIHKHDPPALPGKPNNYQYINHYALSINNRLINFYKH